MPLFNIERLLPERKQKSIAKSCLSKQELQDQIVSHFEFRLSEESTTDGILFPTNFMIYLSRADYEIRKETFASTVRQLVNKAFKRVLDKALQKDPGYEPHSEYWQFQFLVFPEDGFIEDRGEKKYGLEPKKVLIQSTIYPTKERWETDAEEETAAGHVVTTVHTKDSLSIDHLAINYESLKGMEALAADKFRVPFGKKLSSDPLSEKESFKPANRAKCILKILSNEVFSSGTTTYFMTSDNLYISGPGEDSMIGGIPVAHINDKEVSPRHILIKKEGVQYRLYARGEVIVDEKTVKPDGVTPMLLENGCQILINGDIAIKFTVK